MRDGAEDILAHPHFSEPHRRRLGSTYPLERLHQKRKRRTAIVDISPDRQAIVRLVGVVLAEHHDEWAVQRRYPAIGAAAPPVEPRRTVNERDPRPAAS